MGRPRGGADLHLHTEYSDGAYTPDGLVAAAVHAGLEAVAVTDHDTIQGVEPVLLAAHGSQVEVVPGVELSTEHEKTEVHILGLFVDVQNPVLRDRLEEFRRKRVERMGRMTHRLREMGMQVSLEDVLALAGRAAPGRVHLALALRNKGYVMSVLDAFRSFIGDACPAYVRRERPSSAAAIALIREAGGVSVMAHPGLTKKDHFIPALVREGLQGIEVYSSTHGREEVRRYLDIARSHGLAVSGGSDCHGGTVGSPLLGTVRLPRELLEQLRHRSAGHISRGSS